MGIQQLDNQALTSFAGEVNRLLSARNTSPDGDREAELFRKIKTAIPATVKRRQAQLYSKMQAGALALKEREELLLLNQILEEKSAERLLLIGELAKLRGISMEQLAAQLKTKAAHA